MTVGSYPLYIRKFCPGWNIFLAKDSEQDLDFDDSNLDEDTDSDHKPPFRRPFIYLLLLLLLVGGTYVFKPELFTPIQKLITSPAKTVSKDQEDYQSAPTSPSQVPQSQSSLPTPRFHEGQLVTVQGSAMATITLRKTASGNEPGATIHAGELLTVIDGAYIDNKWIYLVHTKSGASGWLSGDQLQSLS